MSEQVRHIMIQPLSHEYGALVCAAVAMEPKWRYDGPMTSIQIKNVPSKVHSELRRRAKRSGQSLQQYLLKKLVDEADRPDNYFELFERVGRSGSAISSVDEADRPDNREILERIGRRKGGSTVTSEQIVQWIREDRGELP